MLVMRITVGKENSGTVDVGVLTTTRLETVPDTLPSFPKIT